MAWQVLDAFPRELVFTPADMRSWIRARLPPSANANATNTSSGSARGPVPQQPEEEEGDATSGAWPSLTPTIDQMVAAGKRLLLVSRSNYGAASLGLAFNASELCSMIEPSAG